LSKIFISSRESQALAKAKPAEFTIRTTSSNSKVVIKNNRDAPVAKTKGRSAKPVPVPKVSGMQSDEDDSLEREVAMSSPMKGDNYRNSVQVCASPYLT